MPCNLHLCSFASCRLHFVLCVAYNAWAMYVLAKYFKDFVLVRQHYLSKGVWRCRQPQWLGRAALELKQPVGPWLPQRTALCVRYT